MESVSVVGLGAMGSRIALRLLGAGYDVTVWNRSPQRLGPLLERGAIGASNPCEAAQRSHTLITMLADPEALRSVSEGPDGIGAGNHPDLVVVEMSTVAPAAVEALASLLEPMSHVVDAPVLGSIGEVEAGTLTIFAGGRTQDLDRVQPVLAALGSVIHVGPRGAGAAAKLVANAALFGTLAVLGETLALADGLGLSPTATAHVLRTTPLADQAQRRLPLIKAGAYPRRFGLSLARKDADLIRASAAGARLWLPALAAAREWLLAAEADSQDDRDYTAVLATILERRVGAVVSCAVESCDYDGLIIDLDGVVWLGGQPIEGVPLTLMRLRADGVKTLFLTNDPERSRETQAERLSAIGIPARADDVLTASTATAAFLADQENLAGARVLVVGSQALQDDLTAAGFELVPHIDAESAQIVVVGGHDRFDYAELRAATRAVGSGADLFATGRDPFVPTSNGRDPGTGSIVAAIETATGATATITGKPERHIFAVARHLLADCKRVAVIGDNLASDIAGAKRVGLETILVLSGATTVAELERAVVQPDHVLPTLAHIDTTALVHA